MIWVTRSEPGASRLVDQLAEHGYLSWQCPLLVIEALPAPRIVDANFEPITETPANPDLVIVLSAHAANAYVSSPQFTKEARHIAIGEQTAAVLSEAGLAVLRPNLATSEGILQMPEVADLGGNSVVWLCAGEGGRRVLMEHFGGIQGCQLVRLEFYIRRTILPERLPEPNIDLVEVSSNAAMQAFSQAWAQFAVDPNRGSKASQQVKLVVASPRLAAAARELGFENVHNAGGAASADILAVLAENYDS